MRTTRRDLFKLGALAAASAALPSIASAAATAPVARAAKPLDILILGGTGFTGPFQVRYALARGHKVTLFNRGKRPSPEWPGDVEQLHGDRNTGDLKALSEAEAHKQFGKNVTIVRPGYIVGPRDETDRFTYWPHRVAQGGEILVPGDGHDPIQIIDGRDLGEWMIRLAEAGTTGTFNACGPDYPLSMDAMLYGCQAVTGGGMRLTHVDQTFLQEQQVGLPIWVPSKDSEYAGYGSVSNQRAIAAGLTFRPLATTVQDLLAWFRSLPAERQAKLNAGVTREKEAELLKAWHARKG